MKLLVMAAIVGLVGCALVVAWLVPTTAEQSEYLAARIAECRSLGGEPILKFNYERERFYLNECRLSR